MSDDNTPQDPADETCVISRRLAETDRARVLSEQAVDSFLDSHPLLKALVGVFSEQTT